MPSKDQIEQRGDDLTECFRHHILTTIGWQVFGARTGSEMQMYEEGFKAGYRRCQSDNEPELGEEECRYAESVGMPQHRCSVRCLHEEKGFSKGIEMAARIADGYDETDTLTAPKEIATATRALKTKETNNADR